MSPRRARRPVERDVAADEALDENDLPDEAIVAVWERAEPVEDGWPVQVAPQAWVDQDGRRHVDLGEALRAAAEIRDRP